MPAGRLYIIDKATKALIGAEVPTMKTANKLIAEDCKVGEEKTYLILSVKDEIVQKTLVAPKTETKHFE